MPTRQITFVSDSDSVDYVIGENTSCTDEETICNRPLQPETTYYVLVRVFTADYYRNSMPLVVTTEPLSKLALILGLTISLTLLAIIAFIVFFLWKTGIAKYVYSFYCKLIKMFYFYLCAT